MVEAKMKFFGHKAIPRLVMMSQHLIIFQFNCFLLAIENWKLVD